MLSQSTESPPEQPSPNSADWLSFGIAPSDAAHAMAQLQDKIAKRKNEKLEDLRAVELVQQLRVQMLGDPAMISDSSVEMLVRRQDYDVLPYDYKIDWRFPIIGPIHGLVRRVINDEIRRFLFPPLRRQSSLNREIVDAIQELAEENQLLRAEISKLKSNATIKESASLSIEPNVNE